MRRQEKKRARLSQQASRALGSYERMPRYTAEQQRSTADVEQVSVPVAGGTLVYRVEREPTTTGSHTVGRQLVGVTDTTDRDALADALADLGHSRRQAYTPALDAEGER